MPHSTRKVSANKVCVYKKDSGERVGCTTPAKLRDYLAALHIHSKEGRGKKK